MSTQEPLPTPFPSESTPTPTPIKDLVIADMQERAEHGKRVYGAYLHSFNGRDGLQDLYEELLDACVYLKQYLVEQEQNQK